MEVIDIVVSTSMQTYYSDDYLRSRSYIFTDNKLADGKQNLTSTAELELRTSTSSIDIYSRNIRDIRVPSFKVVLSAKSESFRFVEIVYGVITFLFLITLCAVFVIACMRCCSKTPVQSDRRRSARNGQNQRNNNQNADQDDYGDEESSEWDDDQVRVQRIR